MTEQYVTLYSFSIHMVNHKSGAFFIPAHSPINDVVTFVKLQTGWSQDQVPHVWDLILAPACLSPVLYISKRLLQENEGSQNDTDNFKDEHTCTMGNKVTTSGACIIQMV